MIERQVAEGHEVSATVLNIATLAPIEFFTQPVIAGNPAPLIAPVTLPQFGGSIENLPFLQTNASTALVCATI